MKMRPAALALNETCVIEDAKVVLSSLESTSIPNFLTQRLQHCSDFQGVLGSALSRGLELTGTALGNIQLMNWQTGCLTIAVQRGLSDKFLDFFRLVKQRMERHAQGRCGSAMRPSSRTCWGIGNLPPIERSRLRPVSWPCNRRADFE